MEFLDERPIVSVNLGNDLQKSRAYPTDLSKQLLDCLCAKQAYNIVLIGDKNDQDRARKYGDDSFLNDKNIYNLTNKTSVAQYVSVIRESDLLITIDSSAMHIAAAVNTPFVTLLGKSTSAFCTVQPKVDFGVYLKFLKSTVVGRSFCWPVFLGKKDKIGKFSQKLCFSLF